MDTAYKALLPYQTFRAKTRDLALAVGSEKLWQIFCRPELASDPRYRRNGDRAKNRATLIPLLQEVLLTKPYEEWEAIFLAKGIPFGAIKDGGRAGAPLRDSGGCGSVAGAGRDRGTLTT